MKNFSDEFDHWTKSLMEDDWSMLDSKHIALNWQIELQKQQKFSTSSFTHSTFPESQTGSRTHYPDQQPQGII
ncbi:MAG: hypothetical protein EZS28_049350, partial [Streblomastix strix]